MRHVTLRPGATANPRGGRVYMNTLSITSNSPNSALCETAVRSRSLRYRVHVLSDEKVVHTRNAFTLKSERHVYVLPKGASHARRRRVLLCPVSALRLATRAQRLRRSTTMRDSVAAGYGAR